MKIYKKEYEDVFTSQTEIDQCKLHLVGNSAGIETDEYIDLLRDAVHRGEKDIFESYLKIEWLRSRFIYNNKSYYAHGRDRYNGNSKIKKAFSVLFRLYVGEDFKVLYRDHYKLIKSYLPELFHNFYERNPFKEEMNYPYEYMTFGCMFLVKSMMERVELLDYGEKHKMKYAHFFDFVVNHINCKNEELGRKVYDVYFLKSKAQIVRRLVKYED